jgi:hypothetical protein
MLGLVIDGEKYTHQVSFSLGKKDVVTDCDLCFEDSINKIYDGTPKKKKCSLCYSKEER